MIEWLGQFVGVLKLLPLRVWVGLSGIPLAGLFLYALIRADLSERSTFKLVHFVTNDAGRGSYYALGYTAIVVAYCWGFFALIMLDKWQVEYLAIGAGIFVLGTLGGTAARVIASVKNATTDPAAGDAAVPEQEPPMPPRNPLAAKRLRAR